jgi:hypothetical protein
MLWNLLDPLLRDSTSMWLKYLCSPTYLRNSSLLILSFKLLMYTVWFGKDMPKGLGNPPIAPAALIAGGIFIQSTFINYTSWTMKTVL